jgi:hypothetical protein
LFRKRREFHLILHCALRKCTSHLVWIGLDQRAQPIDLRLPDVKPGTRRRQLCLGAAGRDGPWPAASIVHLDVLSFSAVVVLGERPDGAP